MAIINNPDATFSAWSKLHNPHLRGIAEAPLNFNPNPDGTNPAASTTSNDASDLDAGDNPALVDKSDEEESEANPWETPLGYTNMTDVKKLTIRDLGTHITNRMRDAIRDGGNDKVNEFDGELLGSPFASESGIEPGSLGSKIINIYLENFADQSTGIKEGVSVHDDSASGDSPIGEDSSGDMETFKVGSISSAPDVQTFVDSYVADAHGLAMGEANVINPPFQFNELDDVRSDFRRPRIGRFYSEEIYDYNMPIVYFQPGTVSIDTSSIKFANSMIFQRQIEYQKFLRGQANTLQWARFKIGNAFRGMISNGAKTLLDLFTWYKWTPNTFRYIRFVNEMLIELAAWMGLLDGLYSSDGSNSILNEESTVQGGAENEKLASVYENEEANMPEDTEAAYESLADKVKNMVSNINEAVWNRLFGPKDPDKSDDDPEQPPQNELADFDRVTKTQAPSGYMGYSDYNEGVLNASLIIPMFKTYHTKHRLGHPDLVKEISFNDTSNDDEKNILTGWPSATLTIPFAIDKGASSSESFSNSTQEHPLTQQYNSMYEESNNTNMVGPTGGMDATTVLNGAVEGGGSGVMEGLKSVVNWGKGEIMQNINEEFAKMGWSGETGMVATGAGRFVLPEVWTDSSFDKSYSISMKFRTVYGHRLFIFENVLVPQTFLIGLTAARKIGIQSYTNPFYVRMYCKGLFSVPMGMITSLSITHGEDATDRTVEGFFRSTSISISVKDMMPQVAMALDGGFLGVTHAANSGMFNYMCQLAGIDFVERGNMQKTMSNNFSKIKNMVAMYDPRKGVAKSNLFMTLNSGTMLGKLISTMAEKTGRGQNPLNNSNNARTTY